MFKIVISGPESTGKTALSGYLSSRFSCSFIPEYARSYIEQLDRPYSYEDVMHIAEVQRETFREYLDTKPKLLIMDTFLVITKIWFSELYGQVPHWIDDYIEKAGIDLCLMCYPDLDWVDDPVRENPGIRRMELLELYLNEYHRFGIRTEMIRGLGEIRFNKAVSAVQKHIPTPGV